MDGLWKVCGWIVGGLWRVVGWFEDGWFVDGLWMVCGWIVEDWSVKPLGELGIIGYAGCPMREEIA